MKVIVADSFIVEFDKFFSKYGIKIDDLVSFLKKDKFIKLKHPYLKLKLTIKGVGLRGVCIKNNLGNIIPLLLVLKKDKVIGENLILNKEVMKKLDIIMGKLMNDFNNGKYKEY